MNCCLQGNSCLWILIILLVLGTNVLSSSALTGCGWPFLVALAYCAGKNGLLSSCFGRNSGCGCNN